MLMFGVRYNLELTQQVENLHTVSALHVKKKCSALLFLIYIALAFICSNGALRCKNS